MAKKRILSLLLVIVMILAMLPANVFATIDDSDTLHQLLFLSDIHSGTYAIDKEGIPCSQFSNLKYMLSNLKAEGLHPEAVTCGGDYTRDTYGDYSDWNDLYAVVNGTIKSNFPDTKAIYTMGNHEWEAASLGSGSDKEALFEKLFGYPRCGVRMVTDDYAIYQIGAQGNNRQGVDKEIFFTQDIQALDDFLATQVGQQRVIFIQTHWPIHSGWNFNYRNITNADLMINTLNKYADDMDIVYFWGHNHYGDPMRQTVQKPGSTITYYAQQGQPSRTRSAEIKFTYVSTGCMNDMWNLQTGGFDMDPGPGVCSFVEIKKDKLVINYRHVENTLSDDPIYDDDATFKSYRPDESVDRIDPPRIYNNPSVVEIKLQHTEFGGEKQYAIKVQNGRGGTASASATKSAPDEEIALTATPKDGYHFKEWQVIDGGVEIKDDGKAVVIITHKLNEVMSVSDRVSILRKGVSIATVNTSETDAQTLTDLMVGRKVSLEIERPEVGFERKDFLKVVDLTCLGAEGHKALDAVSFSLRSGEIMGVAGIAGSGQRELCEAIAGLYPVQGGAILCKSENSAGEVLENIVGMTPTEIIKKGVAMAFVPEDRLGMGLVASMDMVDNMMLKSYGRGKGMFVDRKTPRAMAEEIKDSLEVVTPGVTTPVRRLSGGNVQKVLVGREIASAPNVLIVAYPVRGLDINSSYTIYNLLNEQKSKGVAVMFIGEDLDVLMELCDRIMVLCGGHVAGIVDPRTVTKDEIGLMMAGERRDENGG